MCSIFGIYTPHFARSSSLLSTFSSMCFSNFSNVLLVFASLLVLSSVSLFLAVCYLAFVLLHFGLSILGYCQAIATCFVFSAFSSLCNMFSQLWQKLFSLR